MRFFLWTGLSLLLWIGIVAFALTYQFEARSLKTIQWTGILLGALILAIALGWLAIGGFKLFYFGMAEILILWYKGKLNLDIWRNKRLVQDLTERVSKVDREFLRTPKLEGEVALFIRENVIFWEELIDVHQIIDRIFRKKRAKLEEHRFEFRALNSVGWEMNNELNGKTRINRLKELYGKIRYCVNFKAKKKIDKLLKRAHLSEDNNQLQALKDELMKIEEEIT